MPKYYATFSTTVEFEADDDQQATELAEAMPLDSADFELDEIEDEDGQEVHDDRIGALNLLHARRELPRPPSDAELPPGLSLYDWMIQSGGVTEQEFADTRNEFRRMTRLEQAHWAGSAS